MFTKNNLKYILILAIGFFWCSSVYLTQEQFLTEYADINFINIAELLFGSISMALGILIFGLLYRKNQNMKLYYTIFMILALVSSIIFFSTSNKYIMSVCMCTTCLVGTAGFGAGYHFSLLANNIEKEYRGRVFAIGYGLGSIGTYLLILLPESFYATAFSLLLYVPLLLLIMFIVLRYTKLDEIIEEKYTNSFKDAFIKISIIVLAMSLLSALVTDAIAIYTIDVPGGYGDTRLYYCLGLLIAGFLVDKKNLLFEILVLVSFVFSILSIVLLKDNQSIKLISALSYSFVAFFVLFRTMSFVNLVDHKKSIVWASAFGLMYSRIMEGILVLFEDDLIDNYTLFIIIVSIVLSLVIIVYFLLYFQNNKLSEKDKLKQIAIKYNLSTQEEKVLNLLISDKSNQEIANELYLSVNTVKNHIASIYRKTSMKKRELKDKLFLKDYN